MEGESVQRWAYMYARRTGGQVCVKMGRRGGGHRRKGEGLLGIPTGTYNRWWREIEIQRARRGERERAGGKRCVFSTTCSLDWRPSCGQWGERSHRPRVSINTDQWQVGTCPLLQQHLAVPLHRPHISHRSQRARTHTLFAPFQRSPSASLFFFLSL